MGAYLGSILLSSYIFLHFQWDITIIADHVYERTEGLDCMRERGDGDDIFEVGDGCDGGELMGVVETSN